MMALRSKLIQWALRLQFAPFTWLFHAYYRLAVLCSRWLVGRVEGVRSIYLTGSLARNSLVYGLSDIDFKIFISGYKEKLSRLLMMMYRWSLNGCSASRGSF
jgi:hypothetical protein